MYASSPGARAVLQRSHEPRISRAMRRTLADCSLPAGYIRHVRVLLGASLLAAVLALTASCGNGTDRHAAEAGPAPQLGGASLEGPFPGEALEGSFRDETGERVNDVHLLLSVGEGGRRAVLLVGRRGRRLCVSAVPSAQIETAQLDCLESYENPPLVVKVVAGGENRRRTDWLAVLGLTRAPIVRTEIDSQRNLEPLPLTVKSWRGFPWSAFAATSSRGALANELAALDDGNEAVVRVPLSWSYNPPCLQENQDVCGPHDGGGQWAEGRDPIRDQSSRDDSDLTVAFAQPAVRRLLAGHRYFIGGTAEWLRCDGSHLGSQLSLRIWPRASFKGEIPYREYAKPGEDVSYREGRAYVEAEGIAPVWIWVDHARRRVVGIELDAFDESVDDERTQAKITKFDVIEKPAPAGGPDDSSQCPGPED
jgi:hypothetical protein